MQKKSVKPPSGHFGQGAIGIAHSALPRAPTLYGDPQLLRKAHQFLTQHQDRLLRSSYGFLLTTLPARHKQLWSCNPIGKETAPEFGTALFLHQSGF